MLSHLDREYFLGRRRSKLRLHNQQQKQSTWQLQKQQVKLYGYEGYLKTWAKNKMVLLQSTATTSRQLQWRRTQCITAEQNTLQSSITSSEKQRQQKRSSSTTARLKNK